MARIYLSRTDGRLSEAGWAEAFPFLTEKGHILSLVGGGGKTTLMYALAHRYAGQGFRTLVTTTTHILYPAGAGYAADMEEVFRLWNCGRPAVIGTVEAESGKLSAPEAEFFRCCTAQADAVLIEADGAKQMPCKVPAHKEPVILPESDIVLGVMGLDAAGGRISEVCFRPEETAAFLRTEKDHILTAEQMADILLSERGTQKAVYPRRFYAVLGKCDSLQRRMTGIQIAGRMRKKGAGQIVLISFDRSERERLR